MKKAIGNHLLSFFQDQLLRLDPLVFKPLHAHQNKIILICIRDLFSTALKIQANRIVLVDETEQCRSDTVFSGPLSQYIQSLFSTHPQIGHLEIKGDLALAKAFMQVWKECHCDWEGYFANLIGDPIAYVLGELFRRSKASLKDTLDHRQQDITAYLQDESHFCPLPDEVETLYQGIDSLRHNVDRLQARLERFQKSLLPSCFASPFAKATEDKKATQDRLGEGARRADLSCEAKQDEGSISSLLPLGEGARRADEGVC